MSGGGGEGAESGLGEEVAVAALAAGEAGGEGGGEGGTPS